MKSKIRTLQIGLDWFMENGGGLDRYFMELIGQASSEDIVASGLVVGRAEVEQESRGSIRSFALRSSPIQRRLLEARRAISTALASGSYDLVVSHFALHSFPALDKIDVPIVTHFHGPWAHESVAQGRGSFSSFIKHFVEGSVYKRSSRCIVLSQAFKNVLTERYSIDPDRVTVIPGGVDTDRFANYAAMARHEARIALGWPTDRPIAFAIRRLVRRMGLDLLVSAIGRVVSRHPDVLLMIAGRGPEHQALDEQIQALGLQHNVQLLGYISDDDLPLAYRAADLSITPTVALEGFGLITVEAMAAGTPAMVTPVGGLPEIVSPFMPDLVLAGTSIQDIEQGLLAWLNGSTKLPDSEACRIYAEENFSWPVTLKRIRSVYEEVQR